MTDFEKGAEDARWAVGQLRHLYEMLLKGLIRDQAEAARGLLGPAIARLEPLTTAYTAPPGSESRETRLESENTRLSAELAALKDGVRGHQRAALEAENTRLQEERRAVAKALLGQSCPCDEEDVCDCPQGRALAAMGLCGFLRHGSCTMPKGHKGAHDHWHLFESDKSPLRPPDARPPTPEKQRGDKT